MKKQTGFTLIELIVAVAILGIMASIAVPNYGSFIRRSQQSSAYNNLVGTISLARIEAVKRSRVITLCVSSNQTSCDAATSENWAAGWIVFVDENGDGTVQTGDDVLTAEQDIPGSLKITSDFGSFLSIAPRGRLRNRGSFVICDSTGEDENGMAINLWVTGLGRQASDSDGDGIVEKLDGSAIDCS